MSKSLSVLAAIGLILLAIGIIEFIPGVIAGSVVNLVFGAILSVVGSTLFRISATRMKKQKEHEENSTYSCKECSLQTNTKKEILYHANTTGHDFAPGAKHRDEIPSANSMEILKIRYAKGEITKEQFDQMKSDIDG